MLGDLRVGERVDLSWETIRKGDREPDEPSVIERASTVLSAIPIGSLLVLEFEPVVMRGSSIVAFISFETKNSLEGFDDGMVCWSERGPEKLGFGSLAAFTVLHVCDG